MFKTTSGGGQTLLEMSALRCFHFQFFRNIFVPCIATDLGVLL